MVCIKPVMHIMDKQVARAPHRRREHSAEFKRELVARSLEPGVSVARLSRDCGINANQLSSWVRQYVSDQQTASLWSTAGCDPGFWLGVSSIESASGAHVVCGFDRWRMAA